MNFASGTSKDGKSFPKIGFNVEVKAVPSGSKWKAVIEISDDTGELVKADETEAVFDSKEEALEEARSYSEQLKANVIRNGGVIDAPAPGKSRVYIKAYITDTLPEELKEGARAQGVDVESIKGKWFPIVEVTQGEERRHMILEPTNSRNRANKMLNEATNQLRKYFIEERNGKTVYEPFDPKKLGL